MIPTSRWNMGSCPLNYQRGILPDDSIHLENKQAWIRNRLHPSSTRCFQIRKRSKGWSRSHSWMIVLKEITYRHIRPGWRGLPRFENSHPCLASATQSQCNKLIFNIFKRLIINTLHYIDLSEFWVFRASWKRFLQDRGLADCQSVKSIVQIPRYKLCRTWCQNIQKFPMKMQNIFSRPATWMMAGIWVVHPIRL